MTDVMIITIFRFVNLHWEGGGFSSPLSLKKAGQMRGFSLIELLVVIAILAILSAIGTVQYMKYVVNAKYSRIQSAMETFKITVEKYYADYDRYPSGTCNYLDSNDEQVLCELENGTFKVAVPGHFCVKFIPKDCGGADGYEIVVSSKLVRNYSRNGPAILVYRNCLYGGGNSKIVCVNNEIHGEHGNCTGYSCP